MIDQYIKFSNSINICVINAGIFKSTKYNDCKSFKNKDFNNVVFI